MYKMRKKTVKGRFSGRIIEGDNGILWDSGFPLCPRCKDHLGVYLFDPSGNQYYCKRCGFLIAAEEIGEVKNGFKI